MPGTVIRGRDLVVPLVSTDGRDSWPETLPVRIGDRELAAEVVWVVPRSVDRPRWTTPSRPVQIVKATEGGGTPGGNPLALLAIPEEATGEFTMLDLTWTPTWIDAPPPVSPEAAVLEFRGADADPPLDDPMEWFRWVLRADLEGRRPPASDLTGLDRRVADAVAAEWRAGLARVAAESRGVAEEISERLVAVVTDDSRPDGDRSMAAWPTDPRQLAGLRSLLLDPDLSPLEVMRAGLAWFDARPAFISWVVEPGGGRSVVELANPTRGELVAIVSWIDRGQEEALVLPPESLTRHVISRPDYPTGSPVGGEVLQIDVDGHRIRLDVGRRSIDVRPPGASFGTLGLARTLAAMSEGFIEAAPAVADTIGILRRRGGRWEVFIEARAPDPPDPEDRVILQFGPSDRLAARLEVRADGIHRVLRGSDATGLEVRTRRGPGRWRAEIEVPERWLLDAIGTISEGVVLIGLERSGPGGLVTFAGPPPPAWREDMPVQAFGLVEWGAAPDTATSTLGGAFDTRSTAP